MTDQENIIGLGKFVFDDNNQEKNCGPVWEKHVQDLYLCFCLKILWFCWLSSVAFQEVIFQKFVTNQLFVRENFEAGYNSPSKDYEQTTFYKKNRVFLSLVGASRSHFFYNWLKTGMFQSKYVKKLFCYPYSQPLYFVMQEKIEDLEFVPGVNFESIDSFKKNGIKYLLISDDSCEEICNSKAFVDIATAGRHSGLSTIYIEHNLFHQSKLGRDLELQNTYIVLSKSFRDVIQVGMLSAQFGLSSEPVDWYRDATSVPYGLLLVDLSPRTNGRLRYCTKTGSIPSKFYIPNQLKQSNFRTMNTQNFFEHTSVYSPNVLIILPQMQKPFLSVLSRKVS